MKLSPWPGSKKRGSRSLKRQIQIYVELSDWLRLRRCAAAQHRPVTALVRELLRPGLDALPEQPLAD